MKRIEECRLDVIYLCPVAAGPYLHIDISGRHWIMGGIKPRIARDDYSDGFGQLKQYSCETGRFEVRIPSRSP